MLFRPLGALSHPPVTRPSEAAGPLLHSSFGMSMLRARDGECSSKFMPLCWLGPSNRGPFEIINQPGGRIFTLTSCFCGRSFSFFLCKIDEGQFNFMTYCDNPTTPSVVHFTEGAFSGYLSLFHCGWGWLPVAILFPDFESLFDPSLISGFISQPLRVCSHF